MLMLVSAERAPAAAPGDNFFVAVTDDAFLYKPSVAADAARELGLKAFRVSLSWAPGQLAMSPGDVADFDRMVRATTGLRIVVTVYGTARAAPLDDAARDAYCSYVRDLLTRYPAINDVVIWNEANLGFFWQPQFKADGTSAAPSAYEALLARCWDVLHAARPGVNVIMTTSPAGNDNPNAGSNVSHSPGAFIRKLGAAYKATGRAKRIFDTVGHNPYGMSSAEPPWQRHLTPSHIAEGDADRLVQALVDGFGGSAQPVPGHCGGAGSSCPSIWYLEAGYQTFPDAARQGVYTGRENDAASVGDIALASGGLTQSTQLTDGIKLAYCQPYVGAFFNFLLWDEPALERWQSGVLWADGTRKASFDALKQVAAAAASGGVDCARLQAAQSIVTMPAGDALLERLEWSSIREFSSFNEIWRFAIAARADVTYRAVVQRVAPRVSARKASTALDISGRLKGGRARILEFPQQRLSAGTYRIVLTVTRKSRTRVTVTRQSPSFAVV
ncbi:MAG TPA: hypothetical protein VH721_00735 [Gaiellaceae bacterium]|jgi:hypothetical protein